MPSTLGEYFEVITGNMPITLRQEEDSVKGVLWLKTSWEAFNMQPTSHITTNEKLLNTISVVKLPCDQKAASLSINQGFTVEIPNKDVFSEPMESKKVINTGNSFVLDNFIYFMFIWLLECKTPSI